MRELHKSIKGTNPDGSRYHALEPEAYAWVHATLIEATVRGRRKFVAPMTRLRDRSASTTLGCRSGACSASGRGDLPEDWDGFRDYFATMSHDRLERNETVDKVVGTLAAREPPPIPGMKALWPVLRLAPARAMKVATVGMLRKPLRARFGLGWTRRDAIEMKLMMRASRAATPLLPKSLGEEMGHRHLAWRSRRSPPGRSARAPTPRQTEPRMTASAPRTLLTRALEAGPRSRATRLTSGSSTPPWSRPRRRASSGSRWTRSPPAPRSAG